MAWRIDEPLIRGEIDNRTRGRVTGRLWFLGRAEPVVLELAGNAWRDVAGHVLRFTNPAPQPGRRSSDGHEPLEGFATEQRGVVGDITASRKVKVPECSMEELLRCYEARKPFPWHWGNSLYLEWHSERNGRVVIESAGYQIEIDPEGAWAMTEAEEAAQQEANGQALIGFMERLGKAMKGSDYTGEDLSPSDHEEDDTGETAGDDDDDAPTSEAEAAADAEQARMDLLLDRVQARIARAEEAGEEPDFEAILEEERLRLRRERGEPEPAPPTPEEEARRAEWIAEMNAAAEEAVKELEAEKWKRSAGDGDGDDLDDERWHPLVERCNALTKRLLDETRAQGWLAGSASPEHPLRELANGVMIAGGKLAGALGTMEDADEWPPEALFAGSVLVRLKKARGHLRDALAGLDAADEQDLAEASWRAEIRAETEAILAEVETLVAEVRAILAAADEGENPDELGPPPF